MALPIHSNQALLEWLKGRHGPYYYFDGGLCMLSQYYKSRYGEDCVVGSTHVYPQWSSPKTGGIRLPRGWDDIAQSMPQTFEAAKIRLEWNGKVKRKPR